MKEEKLKFPVSKLPVFSQGVKIGVSAIILNSHGKVLLCQRKDLGWWIFPGGGVEEGESLEKAALREVKEETGLEIILERISGIYLKTKEKNIVIVFRAKPKSKRITKKTAETKDVKWFSFKKANFLLSPNLRQRFKDAFFSGETVYFRVQDTLPFRLWLDLKKRDIKRFLFKKL
ncbi:MAG: NUDIX hydrolase [Microgenomates group bacterium]